MPKYILQKLCCWLHVTVSCLTVQIASKLFTGYNLVTDTNEQSQKLYKEIVLHTGIDTSN